MEWFNFVISVTDFSMGNTGEDCKDDGRFHVELIKYYSRSKISIKQEILSTILFQRRHASRHYKSSIIQLSGVCKYVHVFFRTTYATADYHRLKSVNYYFKKFSTSLHLWTITYKICLCKFYGHFYYIPSGQITHVAEIAIHLSLGNKMIHLQFARQPCCYFTLRKVTYFSNIY
jgi:hypothetical protein